MAAPLAEQQTAEGSLSTQCPINQQPVSVGDVLHHYDRTHENIALSDVYLANSLRRGAVQQERQGGRHLMCLVMLHPQSGSREGNAGLQLISIIVLFFQSGTPAHGMAPPNHGGSYPLLNVNTLTDTRGCFLDNSKFRRVDSGDQPSSYCLKIFIQHWTPEANNGDTETFKILRQQLHITFSNSFGQTSQKIGLKLSGGENDWPPDGKGDSHAHTRIRELSEGTAVVYYRKEEFHTVYV